MKLHLPFFFARVFGRFRVSGISSMLRAIRDKDGGIATPTADGKTTWVLPSTQGMIDFSGIVDYGSYGTQCHGAGAAFGVTQPGSEYTIKYNTIAITEKDMGSLLITMHTIPEPATSVLSLLGVLTLTFRRCRK